MCVGGEGESGHGDAGVAAACDEDAFCFEAGASLFAAPSTSSASLASTNSCLPCCSSDSADPLPLAPLHTLSIVAAGATASSSGADAEDTGGTALTMSLILTTGNDSGVWGDQLKISLRLPPRSADEPPLCCSMLCRGGVHGDRTSCCCCCRCCDSDSQSVVAAGMTAVRGILTIL